MKKYLIGAAVLTAVLLGIGFICCPVTHADGVVGRVYIGSNVAWHNGVTPEAEVGGNASLGLSPHIDIVASGYHGLEHNYWVPRIGGRITATDADNRNFSIAVGAEYQGTKSIAGPKEWVSTAQVGWRPRPNGKLDPLLLVGQGSYGTKSHTPRPLIGLRWAIKL